MRSSHPSVDDRGVHGRIRQRRESFEHDCARRATAFALVNILDAAAERELDPCSLVIVDHRAVLEARGQILELVARLRRDVEVSPRALGLARQLAEDPRSPMFGPRSDRTVGDALAEIFDAL
jgi:hypothetical protein